MKNEVITTLSLLNYGLTPCSSIIEARKLKNGFSVILDADGALQRPVRIGFTKKDYNWRIFGEILCGIKEGFITQDAYRNVVVDGESVIRADLLVLCWSAPAEGSWLADWLLT